MSGLAGYEPEDSMRRVAEAPKRSGRTDFQRDRARVLHSAGLRRLAATTQVMVALENDFPRTRLTHSLECAQIGRELGAALGCDPDLVETACLAHDLGHPPFGHNGENALHAAAEACGGFEGNAQSFRVLTRLEAKVIDADGRSAGLNLTRAALDAATKYPWTRRAGSRKFGVYLDDRPVFDWLRSGVAGEDRPLESHVMDWADDVAYSVHDVEDGLHSGLIVPADLRDESQLAGLFALCRQRYAPGSTVDELAAALRRLQALPAWPTEFDASHAALARLKGLTSHLIGRFCSAAEDATRARFGAGPLRRYDAELVVPKDIADECAVLKAVAAVHVMERDGAEEVLAEQRRVIGELVDALVADPRSLGPTCRAMYEAATDDAGRLRAVIDQVAALTDHSALAWHRRLCS